MFFFILARFALLVLQLFVLLNFEAPLQAGKIVTDATNNVHDAIIANLFTDIFMIFRSFDSDAKIHKNFYHLQNLLILPETGRINREFCLAPVLLNRNFPLA